MLLLHGSLKNSYLPRNKHLSDERDKSVDSNSFTSWQERINTLLIDDNLLFPPVFSKLCSVKPIWTWFFSSKQIINYYMPLEAVYKTVKNYWIAILSPMSALLPLPCRFCFLLFLNSEELTYLVNKIRKNAFSFYRGKIKAWKHILITVMSP